MTGEVIDRLSWREKLALAAEIVREYARVRRALRQGGLQQALDGARAATPRPSNEADRLSLLDDLRIARASVLVLRLLPTDTRCLMRSLVVLALLARRGRAATLVIGVQPGTGLEAHSWLERSGRPILPPEGFPRLVVL